MNIIEKLQNKKMIITVITSCIMIIIFATGSKVINDRDKTVALINNEPITKREYNQLFSSQEDMDYMKKVKIEQQLFKERGITKDTSYKEFIKSYNGENKRRKKAKEKGEVIYGPVQYQPDMYFYYIHSNRVIKLKEILWTDELKADHMTLKNYYENTRENYLDYKKQDYIETKVVKITPAHSEDEPNIKGIRQIFGKYSNIFDNLTDFRNSVQQEGYKVDVINRIFDESTSRNDLKYDYEIYEQVNKLKVNQISDAIEHDTSIYIFKCINRKNGDYYSYEDKKQAIITRYIDEKYKQLIEGLTNKAQVKIIDNSLLKTK